MSIIIPLPIISNFAHVSIMQQIAPAEDFIFTVVDALNGEAGAVSFQSVNYPTYFLSLATASGVDIITLTLCAS